MENELNTEDKLYNYWLANPMDVGVFAEFMNTSPMVEYQFWKSLPGSNSKERSRRLIGKWRNIMQTYNNNYEVY